MIFRKQALLALGVAGAASPFSRVGAVSLRGDEKSPLDAIARKLAKKKLGMVVKEPSEYNGLKIEKEESTGGEHSSSSSSSSSKGAKNPPNSSKAHKESTPFFVASAACAQKCISAEFGPDTHFLTNAIQHCDAASSRQMWDVLQDGTFVKFKYVAASGDPTNGHCLGVAPQVVGGLGVMYDHMFYVNQKEDLAQPAQPLSGLMILDSVNWVTAGQKRFGMSSFSLTGAGDGWGDHDMCSNGSKLGLVSCDHLSAQWSSTNGQLISPFCWGIGLSSILSVNEECTDLQLSTTSDGTTAISRAETFMAVTQAFIETIPPPPVPTYYPTSRTYYPTTATDTPTFYQTTFPTKSPTDAPPE